MFAFSSLFSLISASPKKQLAFRQFQANGAPEYLRVVREFTKYIYTRNLESAVAAKKKEKTVTRLRDLRPLDGAIHNYKTIKCSPYCCA